MSDLNLDAPEMTAFRGWNSIWGWNWKTFPNNIDNEQGQKCIATVLSKSQRMKSSHQNEFVFQIQNTWDHREDKNLSIPLET